MKKVIIASLILVMVFGLGTAFANPEGIPHGAKLIGKLNIIGVKKPKNVDLDKDTGIGSVIFVSMEGHNKIGLVESGSADAPEIDPDDFAVLDKHAYDVTVLFSPFQIRTSMLIMSIILRAKTLCQPIRYSYGLSEHRAARRP